MKLSFDFIQKTDQKLLINSLMIKSREQQTRQLAIQKSELQIAHMIKLFCKQCGRHIMHPLNLQDQFF